MLQKCSVINTRPNMHWPNTCFCTAFGQHRSSLLGGMYIVESCPKCESSHRWTKVTLNYIKDNTQFTVQV